MVYLSLRKIVNRITQNWKTTLRILGLDILFLVIFFGIRAFLQNIYPNIFNVFLDSSNIIQILGPYVLLIGEILLFLIVYSLFKYTVMILVENYFHKIKFSMKNFSRFFKVNLFVLSIASIIIYLVVLLTSNYLNNLIIEGTQNPIIPVLIIMLLVLIWLIILFYFYTIVNLHHFAQNKLGFLAVVKRAFIDSFSIKTYKLYLEDLKIIYGYIAVMGGGIILYILLGFSASSDLFRTVILFLSLSVLYFLHSINRINFYLNSVK